MNKKRALVLAGLLAAALLLSACGAKGPELEGKWNAPNMGEMMGMGADAEAPQVVYQFKNGKLEMTMNGKPAADFMKETMKASDATEDMIENAINSMPVVSYRVDGSKITLSTTIQGRSEEITGEFKIEGDKLSLPDGKGGFVELTRVK